MDGGDSLRSITCSPDRSCELAATDSVITLCGGGAGFAGGTGGFEGDKLVFPDAVLTCPNGTTVNLAIRYERDPLNRTLVETTVVLDTDTILPTSSSTRSAGKPRELSIPSSVRAPAARR